MSRPRRTRAGRGALLALAVLFGVPLLTGAVVLPMVGLPAVGATEVALLVALLAPVVVVVLVLAVGVRALDAGRARDDAIEELRRAYARGEIDDEEFERRRTRLEADR